MEKTLMDMVVEVKKYVQSIRRKIEPYFAEKKPKVSTYRCCLSLAGKEIKMLLINQSQGVLEVCLSETLHYEDTESLSYVLSALVKKHQLDTTPVYWLLAPEDYQLFLIDSLAVEKDEFRSALNWRLRNLISYPITEAAIDYFPFPSKKQGNTTGTNTMIAAVTSRMSQLSSVIEVFKKANLNLTTIDIPELALRNLTARHENDEKSTALIYFYENSVILNISHQKALYFTRHIDLRFETEAKIINYEYLSLDIMRYFDFFQSQWRLPVPSRIFIAAGKGDRHETGKMLSKFLLMPVELFSLDSILFDKKKSTLIESHYLLQLGCVLREEVSHV